LEKKSKNNGRYLKIKKLWKNGVFRSLLLIVIVIGGVFLFEKILVLGLQTNYPLQTPISKSMEPTLKVGDLLVVQGIKNAESVYANPNDGEIIVFRDPRNLNNFIVHRAINKTLRGGAWYFETKGDNNASPDPWSVPENNLIGKVIWHLPLIGYVKIYLGTPIGVAVTVVLLIAILFLEEKISTKNPKNSRDSISK
jgi:signal peptidase